MLADQPFVQSGPWSDRDCWPVFCVLILQTLVIGQWVSTLASDWSVSLHIGLWLVSQSRHRPLIGQWVSTSASYWSVSLHIGLWFAPGQLETGWRQPGRNVRHTWRHVSFLWGRPAGPEWELCQLCQHCSTLHDTRHTFPPWSENKWYF